MNKTAQTELHRSFLIEGLPEPLTAASSHVQIFDNYIINTRLRLRKIRDPHSKAWTRILQQRFPVVDGEYGNSKLAEIYLNDGEYSLFEHLEGREVRKNRYFHEYDNVSVAFDIYLGAMVGLTTARIDFEDHAGLEEFVPPPFAIIEITDDVFFAGENLVDRTSADIRSKLASSVN
jgi:CYTH domain-containing protein